MATGVAVAMLTGTVSSLLLHTLYYKLLNIPLQQPARIGFAVLTPRTRASHTRRELSSPRGRLTQASAGASCWSAPSLLSLSLPLLQVGALGVTGAAAFVRPSAHDVSFGLGLLGATASAMAACGATNVALGDAHAEVRVPTTA